MVAKTMKHISFLISETETIEDGNYLRFANELFHRGFKITVSFMDSLSMENSFVCAQGFVLDRPLVAGTAFPEFELSQLQEADLIWVLSLGKRHSFLDKIQLLYCLERFCGMINTTEALMHLKSKYSLANHGDIFQYPKTFASTNPDTLYRVIQSDPKLWIAKPPAGSMGRDIFLLDAEDPNARVILESMTGPDADQYCLLQAYAEEIQAGEKRVIFADGKVVGQYLRIAKKDHRTNLVQGAEIEACELSADETRYCEKIGQLLVAEGARFVGVDLAFPYVIEFNVINPGGLLTIESLTGKNLSADIIDRIFP